MIDSSKISDILNNYPSVELLRLRNREAIIVFLINTFSTQQGAVSSENIHVQLGDYLEFMNIEKDEENEIEVLDSYLSLDLFSLVNLRLFFLKGFVCTIVCIKKELPDFTFATL